MNPPIAFQIKEINRKINTFHNPGLIDPTSEPNGNTIYKIYDNGEITMEKGGWAYGNRSLFSMEPELFWEKCDLGLKFPETNHRKIGFAIVTRDQAYQLRSQIKNLYQNFKITPETHANYVKLMQTDS